MAIEYFEFKAIPRNVMTPYRALEVYVRADGEVFQIRTPLPEQRSYESEIEFFGRLAIDQLKRCMSDKLSDKPDTRLYETMGEKTKR